MILPRNSRQEFYAVHKNERRNMMDIALPLLTFSGLRVETVVALGIIVFGNVLPLGLIAWLFWYAARRYEVIGSVAPRPIVSQRVKRLRQAA